MRRALLIISICALVVLAVAIIGQALVFAQGVVYTPAGLPTQPTPLAIIASWMAGVGGVLSMPLTLAVATLGLVVTAQRRRIAWIIAIVIAGALAMMGLFAMAWILLSANSPVAFVAPLALVPLVTLLAALQRETAPTGAVRASSDARQ